MPVEELLKNDIKYNRLASGYLFVGMDIDKEKETALNFARALNCSEVREGEPCKECLSCRKITSFNHPDIHWIDTQGTSSIKIKQIREISSNIYLKPYEARRSVYVLLEADIMTEAAQNALLKTLEEPPAEAHLILIASNIRRLLPTVVSRCRIVRFLQRGEEKGEMGENFCRILKLIESDKVIDDRELEFDKREDIGDLLDELMVWFRDILAVKAAAEEVLINTEMKQEILKRKERYSFNALEKILNSISRTKDYIIGNANKKLALQVMIEEIREL